MENLAGILARHGGRIRGRACLRLHGEDREGMEERTGDDWSRIVRPKDEDLARIVPGLESLVDMAAPPPRTAAARAPDTGALAVTNRKVRD